MGDDCKAVAVITTATIMTGAAIVAAPVTTCVIAGMAALAWAASN